MRSQNTHDGALVGMYDSSATKLLWRLPKCYYKLPASLARASNLP